jgi:hypothetical protein
MMIRRLLLALMLSIAALRAGATDFTDIWYLATEAGWGVNVVQSDTFIFLTFFVYGPGGQPTWYTGQVTEDANGNFNGTLYSTMGTYFAMPWMGFTGGPAGTVSFFPTSATTATLVYTVTGAPTVTKNIQRQTLTSIALGASYSGGQAGGYSGCTDPSQNFLYKDTFDLDVTQQTDNSVTFAFTYSGVSCTLSGTLVQQGKLYSVPNASYVCSDGLNTNASMSEIQATAQGIEGRFSAPSVGGNCAEDASFSGVLL